MRRALGLILLGSLVSRHVHGQPTDEAAIQAALDDPHASCSKLVPFWQALSHEQSPSAFHKALLQRLQDRMVRLSCFGRPGKGDAIVKPRTNAKRLADYQEQLAELEQRRAECKNLADCPDLVPREIEVGRCAANLVCRLPKDSSESEKVKKTLGVAFGSDLSAHALVNLVKSRALSEDELSTLFDLILAADSDLAAKAKRLLNRLNNEQLSDDQATDLLDEVLRLHAKHGAATVDVLRRAEVVNSLRDPKKRKVLGRVLDIIQERYPQMGANAQRVRSDIEKSAMSERLTEEEFAVRFFASVDPVVLEQINKEVRLTNAQLRKLDTQTGYSMAQSPVLAAFGGSAAPANATCLAGREFVQKFVESLHYRGGPSSGLLPPVEVTDTEALKTQIPEILRAARTDDASVCAAYKLACKTDGPAAACTDAMTPYAGLCSPPFPGVFLLELSSRDDGWMIATGVWWERMAAGGFTTGPIATIRFHGCDKVDEDTAAFQTASSLVRQVSLFKKGPCVGAGQACLGGSGSKPAKSSGWYAAAFSGIPYMLDAKATSTSRLVPSILDGVFLVGTATFAGLSLKYRDDYSNGRVNTLDAANNTLTLSYAFAGGLLLTRILSGVLYETAPSAWQKAEFSAEHE
jgi:hypothetical protein